MNYMKQNYIYINILCQGSSAFWPMKFSGDALEEVFRDFLWSAVISGGGERVVLQQVAAS